MFVFFFEEFEQFLKSLFEYYGFSVMNNKHDSRYDLVVKKGEITLFIEAKSSSQKHIPVQWLKNAVNQVKRNYPANSILVVCGYVEDAEKEASDIPLLDLSGLLFLASNNEELYQQLLSLVGYSIDGIEPMRPDKLMYLFEKGPAGEIALEYTIPQKTEEKNCQVLIERLETWNHKGKTHAQEYELLCTDILKYLFLDDLGLWQSQKPSNDGLFRFDLICKIKDSSRKSFWTFLIDFFRSKYVVFEFKNYTGKITQREIYTTEKYLYSNAFRSVAFIISWKGNDDNSDKAIRGILRESGKLIICLSNKNLICLLKMKQKGDDIDDYLSKMLDNLLIELDK